MVLLPGLTWWGGGGGGDGGAVFFSIQNSELITVVLLPRVLIFSTLYASLLLKLVVNTAEIYKM